MVPLVRSTKDHKKEAGVEVAVGDHRASNVGGCLGQGLSETTGERRCFEEEGIPAADRGKPRLSGGRLLRVISQILQHKGLLTVSILGFIGGTKSWTWWGRIGLSKSRKETW